MTKHDDLLARVEALTEAERRAKEDLIRAETVAASAEENLRAAKKELEETFGVGSVAEAVALLSSLEAEVEADVARLEAALRD